ncbi:MAG TPA: serine/threonine protein kinase, partial [Streptomyces sp.]|nr:serine/threonine protein kinase [Streptomyces sp.]
YISPERARGHKPGPAADLWSLGGLLYAAVEGGPPYDKGSAIATLTAVMTEPLEEPKNAGLLRDVIHGLLDKDPAERLDDAGARAMLNAVIHGPAVPAPELDATTVVPLPAQPDRREDGGRRGEEAGERLRGALRSVRRAAAAGAAEGAASAGGGSGGAAGGPAPGTSAGAAATGTGARTSAAADAGSGAESGGRSRGWPVMPPPDLPSRPAPKASLTDVVPRRTLIVVAVVVVLAVLGVVLAVTLGGGEGDRAGGGGKPVAGDTKTGGSGETSEDGDEKESPGSGSKDGTPGSGTPSAEASRSAGPGGSSGGAAPADSTHKGRQGYAIGLPEGWKYQSNGSAGDRFTGPQGQRLLVAWTSTPKGDPVADWRSQEKYMVRDQYRKVRITKVDYRGWDTADWEFTYVENGTKYRTIDRGFVVGDHLGYALMYTAKAANWDDGLREDTWRTLTGTFEPKS